MLLNIREFAWKLLYVRMHDALAAQTVFQQAVTNHNTIIASPDTR